MAWSVNFRSNNNGISNLLTLGLISFTRFSWIPCYLTFLHQRKYNSWASAVPAYGLLISGMHLGHHFGQFLARTRHFGSSWFTTFFMILTGSFIALCFVNRFFFILLLFGVIGCSGSLLNNVSLNVDRGNRAFAFLRKLDDGGAQKTVEQAIVLFMFVVLFGGYLYDSGPLVRIPMYYMALSVALVCTVMAAYFMLVNPFFSHNRPSGMKYQAIGSGIGSGNSGSSMDPTMLEGGYQAEVISYTGLVPSNFYSACGGNLQKAKLMYGKMLEWRDQNAVDDIFTIPRNHFHDILKFYPHAIHGYSLDGCAVVYEILGKGQPKALNSAGVSLEDLVWHFALRNELVFTRLLEPETMRQLLKDAPPGAVTLPFPDGYEGDDDSVESNQQGVMAKPVRKLMTVLDVGGISITSVTTDVISFIKRSGELIDNYYPEQVARLVICNAPRWFSSVWTLIARVLPESVQKKIDILYDYKGLDKYIHPSQRPREYGGTDVDLGHAPGHLAFLKLEESWREVDDDNHDHSGGTDAQNAGRAGRKMEPPGVSTRAQGQGQVSSISSIRGKTQSKSGGYSGTSSKQSVDQASARGTNGNSGISIGAATSSSTAIAAAGSGGGSGTGSGGGSGKKPSTAASGGGGGGGEGVVGWFRSRFQKAPVTAFLGEKNSYRYDSLSGTWALDVDLLNSNADGSGSGTRPRENSLDDDDTYYEEDGPPSERHRGAGMGSITGAATSSGIGGSSLGRTTGPLSLSTDSADTHDHSGIAFGGGGGGAAYYARSAPCSPGGPLTTQDARTAALGGAGGGALGSMWGSRSAAPTPRQRSKQVKRTQEQLEEHGLVLAIQAAHLAATYNKPNGGGRSIAGSGGSSGGGISGGGSYGTAVGMNSGRGANSSAAGGTLLTAPMIAGADDEFFSGTGNARSMSKGGGIPGSNMSHGDLRSCSTSAMDAASNDRGISISSAVDSSLAPDEFSGAGGALNSLITVKISAYIFMLTIALHLSCTWMLLTMHTLLPVWLVLPLSAGGLEYGVRDVALVLSGAAMVVLLLHWLLAARWEHVLKASPVRALRIGCGLLMAAVVLMPWYLSPGSVSGAGGGITSPAVISRTGTNSATAAATVSIPSTAVPSLEAYPGAVMVVSQRMTVFGREFEATAPLSYSTMSSLDHHNVAYDALLLESRNNYSAQLPSQSLLAIITPSILLGLLACAVFLCRKASAVMLHLALNSAFHGATALQNAMQIVLEVFCPLLTTVFFSIVYALRLQFPLDASCFFSQAAGLTLLVYMGSVFLTVQFRGDYGVMSDYQENPYARLTTAGAGGSGATSPAVYSRSGAAQPLHRRGGGAVPGSYSASNLESAFRTPSGELKYGTQVQTVQPQSEDIFAIPLGDINLLFSPTLSGYGSKLYNLRDDFKDV